MLNTAQQAIFTNAIEAMAAMTGKPILYGPNGDALRANRILCAAKGCRQENRISEKLESPGGFLKPGRGPGTHRHRQEVR